MHRIFLVDGLPNINLQDISLEQGLLAELATVKGINAAHESALPDEVFDSDVLISWHYLRLSGKTFGRLRNCKGIVRAGVGFDNVDIQAAGAWGVPVFNVPDYAIHEVADHTMALILALTRRLKIYDQEVARGRWSWETGKPIRRLSTLTLGIVGCGRIGTQVVRRAQAFGFRVVFFDPYLPDGIEKTLGAARCQTLQELLPQSDIVSLHVPLTSETQHMISSTALSQMKPGSILVNTARGAVVDTEALVKTLQAGTLGGAGLDVLETEPRVVERLKNDARVIVTPHSAFYSEESRQDLRRRSAELARAILLNEPLPQPVNQEYLVYAK